MTGEEPIAYCTSCSSIPQTHTLFIGQSAPNHPKHMQNIQQAPARTPKFRVLPHLKAQLPLSDSTQRTPNLSCPTCACFAFHHQWIVHDNGPKEFRRQAEATNSFSVHLIVRRRPPDHELRAKPCCLEPSGGAIWGRRG